MGKIYWVGKKGEGMLLSANLSAGDFLDRLSILQIKSENGLDVSNEILEYERQLFEFEEQGLTSYLRVIKSINIALWELEDIKRTQVERYTPQYSNVSELITELNDLRYQTKKRIDKYFKSEISEKKSHKE
jgi:hypothetical protein